MRTATKRDRLLAALVLAWSVLVASAAAAEQRRYVLIIGNNQSLDRGVKPLRYADDDAVRYYQLFSLTTSKVALFTVLDDDTARLYPEMIGKARPPRSRDIFATLSRWNTEMAAARQAGDEPELIFIYAGHGDRDASGEGYVNLQQSKLRRRDLYQRVLAPSKASFIHLIIDACKSYFLVNRRGAGGDEADQSHAAEIRAFLKKEELAAYPHAGVILATSGDQSTHEWNRYRGGILSHELRSALAGAADINGDGRVEYSEVHAFVAAANARVKHPEARLRIFARSPAANRHRPLVDLRQAHGARLLRFDRRLAGKYHLEDDRGVRVADLHKSPGIRFDVAVDRQRSFYLRRAPGNEAKILPGDGRIEVAALSFKPGSLAARSASLDRSFRRDLYKISFSRGFYEGFCVQAGHVPVAGKSVEFVIERPAGRALGARHELLAGYVLSSALLDLEGVNHGFALGYSYLVLRHFSVGAMLQYARSVHDGEGGSGGEGTARLDRFAALVGAAARAEILPRLSARAEIYLGYQGYFGSGQVTVKLDGKPIQGSDPLGFRFEAGLAARLDLTSFLFVDARGGLGIELVTIEPDEQTHVTPYFGASLGTRF